MPDRIDAAPSDATELNLYLGSDVPDARLERFAGLRYLSVGSCPAELTLPESLLALSALASLTLRADKGVTVRVPALVGRLPLTEMDLDNVDPASLPLPATLTALKLWSRTAAADLEILLPRLAALPHLRSLALRNEGDPCRLPTGLGALPALAALDLGGFAGPLPADLQGAALTELTLTVTDLASDLHGLAGLDRLERLTLSGREATGDLETALGALPALRGLTLGVPVRAWPSALAGHPGLTELVLGVLPDRAVPEGVCGLPALRALQVGAAINTLPAGFGALATLRILRLRGALNGGRLISRYDDVSQLKPLPKALSALVELEVLDLSHCAVLDLEPLRPLSALRELHLSWCPVTTLEPLAAARALEVLDLEHADRLTDLAPLAGAPQLRTLNLSNTRLRDLEPLRTLPALRALDLRSIRTKNVSAVYDLDVALEASDEILEAFARRAELRKLPPIAEMVRDLGSADVAVAARAVDHVATWTLASSTRDGNAIRVALGLVTPPPPAPHRDDSDDDDDDEVQAPPDRATSGELPPLDRCLDRHLAALDPLVLAHLFAALFQRMEEDWATAHRVADEVVRRGDDDAQARLVDAFRDAGKYYDSGHRMWEDTLQDHLIDQAFPELRGPALARLLSACDDGQLTEDGMAALWVPALDRAGAADEPVLAERLTRFVRRRLEYGTGSEIEVLWATLDAVESDAGAAVVRTVRGALEPEIAVSRARKAVEADLEARSDPARVRRGLEALAALPEAEHRELVGALWSASATPGLNEVATVALLRLWRGLDNNQGVAQVLTRAVTTDLRTAERAAAGAGLEGEALGPILRRASASEAKSEMETILRDAWGLDLLDDDEEEDEEEPEAASLPAPRPPSPTVERLGAWADRVQGLDLAQGRLEDLRAAAERLGHYERAWFCVAIERLAAAGSAEGLAPEVPRKLADDLGLLADDESLWPYCRLLARNLHLLGASGTALERILAQLVAIAMRSDDPQGVAALLLLVPEEVKWEILAYNLACYHAVRGDRDGTLRYTARSIALGKSPAQFAADSDFDGFRSDPAFQAVLATVD